MENNKNYIKDENVERIDNLINWAEQILNKQQQLLDTLVLFEDATTLINEKLNHILQLKEATEEKSIAKYVDYVIEKKSIEDRELCLTGKEKFKFDVNYHVLITMEELHIKLLMCVPKITISTLNLIKATYSESMEIDDLIDFKKNINKHERDIKGVEEKTKTIQSKLKALCFAIILYINLNKFKDEDTKEIQSLLALIKENLGLSSEDSIGEDNKSNGNSLKK